jgi:hypothetical protein
MELSNKLHLKGEVESVAANRLIDKKLTHEVVVESKLSFLLTWLSISLPLGPFPSEHV